MTTEIIEAQSGELSLANSAQFEHMQRVAKALCSSELVPAQFKGNIANCIIALEMASRMKASPFAVMQQMYIVHGKPSWSSQFVIACINSCGKFKALRFDMSGTQGKDDRACIAWTVEIDVDIPKTIRTLADAVAAKLPILEGPLVSIDMAKKEGWFGKNGSKWQTLPELMLRYRAATFFGRLYAPEVMMGMSTNDELSDMGPRAQRSALAAIAAPAESEEPEPITTAVVEIQATEEPNEDPAN